jgi:TrmH family RNA methyltransferase
MKKKSAKSPPSSDVAVVLVSTRNPLNIGAAARAMSNFGFRALRVVNPYDVAFREAKSAVGAVSILTAAREYSSTADAVADCSLVIGTTAARNRRLDHPLHSLDEAARLIRKHSGKVALLFGSEKRGLSNHDLSYCHWLLRIPTREDHPSVNLGQAVALCLYELARQSGAGTKPSTRPAPAAAAGELHRLADILVDTLQTASYPKAAGPEFAERIQRLVRRLHLSKEDTQLLSGMFRQVLWKMRGN